MKKVILYILVFCLPITFLSASSEYSSEQLLAQRSRVKKQRTRTASSSNDLRNALALARQGRNAEAAQAFFKLTLNPRYRKYKTRMRYLLGVTLSNMGLHQLAAFQFIAVIQAGSSKYLSGALQKLSIAADTLGDETLLNFAIARMKASSFPASHRDMLFYRIGEFQLRNKQYDGAIRSFSRVSDSSPYYNNAQYEKAFAYAKSNRPKQAVRQFEELIIKASSEGVTNTARVAALMGKARSLYQMKDWDGAIETYREVPKDSSLWHDTLFESSWAMLRSGRFRSALSNFQSLHSPYYEHTYLPESLLLRSIVYLYICQYDEMDKVLNLFNNIYRPVYMGVTEYLKNNKNSQKYFIDAVRVLAAAEKPDFDPDKVSSPIPYIAIQKIIREGDFKRSYEYIKSLMRERDIAKAQAENWQKSGLGKYAISTLNRRISRARAKAGRQIRAHLLAIRTDLVSLFEQEGFIRYEMINGQKEILKKKVAGKDLPEQQINEKEERDFYIQNGYQYWTFRGEYWLDELGNYHYVGTQSCL